MFKLIFLLELVQWSLAAFAMSADVMKWHSKEHDAGYSLRGENQLTNLKGHEFDVHKCDVNRKQEIQEEKK